MPNLFPLFLKLEGTNCLVIGGSSLLAPKVQVLAEAGARVRVVAEEIAQEIEDAIRDSKSATIVSLEQRRFELADLDGVGLVIAADRDQSINELVSRESRARGILCNVVDQPTLCTFHYPAVVRRGPLQIAVSTAGMSPSLSGSIRQELERQYGPEYEAWVESLGAARTLILAKWAPSDIRTRLLKSIVTDRAFHAFRYRHSFRQEGARQ